jgi:hypothetical protein
MSISLELHPLRQGDNRIQTGTLQKGIYRVRVTNGKDQKTIRILKNQDFPVTSQRGIQRPGF